MKWGFWATLFKLESNNLRWIMFVADVTLPCAPNYRPRKAGNDNVKRIEPDA